MHAAHVALTANGFRPDTSKPRRHMTVSIAVFADNG